MDKLSDGLLRNVLNSPLPTMCAKASGAILASNRQCHDFVESSVSTTEEQTWFAFVDAEDKEKSKNYWDSIISHSDDTTQQQTYSLECRMRLKNSEVAQWYRLFFSCSEHIDSTSGAESLAVDSRPWVLTFVPVHEDVVTRSRFEMVKRELSKSVTESHLNSSEKLLMQRLIDSVPALVWTANRNGDVLFVSQSPKANTLLPWQTIEKSGWGSVIHSDTAQEVKTRWEEGAFKNEPFDFELMITQQDGTGGWYRVNANPVKDDQGNIIRWFGACCNVSIEKNLSASLQAALKTRSNFVAQVSHELRTPLNGMLPLIEMLLRCNLDDEAKSRVMTLRDAGGSLLHVINEILDFSKLESGKVEAEFSDFDLLELVEGVAQILAPAAASKDLLLLSVMSSDVPVTIKGDAQKLRQVLLNLCGNAVKFTDKGHVQLSVKTTVNDLSQPALLFSVSDTGPGIDHASLKQLFEPFFQGSGSSHRERAGTGLGLSISRRLVELMGGTISVDSQPDRGSTFKVMLPLAARKVEPTRTACNLPSLRATRVNVLTFEPCNYGQWLIGDTVKILDSVVDSTDDVDVASRYITDGARAGQGPYQILIVDMVRYKEQSLKLIERIKKEGRSAALTIVGVVADNTEDNSEFARNLQIKMTMPLRRASLVQLFDSISNSPRKHSRAEQTSTLQLTETIETEPFTWLQQPGQKKRVLVADDNNMNRYVANLLLTELGFDVDMVNDGVEAVQACKVKCYSLIFLDCRMPRLDGFEATSIIKEVHGRRNIAVPIIAVTANAAEGTREECLAHGMDDYISKPIEPQIVQAVVEKWLGRSKIKESFKRSSQSWPHLSTEKSHSVINYSKLYGRFSDAQIKEILEVFIESCSSSFDRMHKLIDSRDFLRFEMAVASLKISCEAMEADKLVRLCDEILLAVQRHDIGRARIGINEMAKLVDQLKRESTASLSEYTTKTLPIVNL